jgi:IclR family acetate operon transcriptional repressor
MSQPLQISGASGKTALRPEVGVVEGAPRSGARTGPRPGRIQSVARALLMLDTIASFAREASLSEIAKASGLNISTCHHLLATLVDGGYVGKVAGRRSYVLGARVIHLGHACLRQVDLPQRAERFVERINVATGETVHLAVLQGDTVMTLVKREARHAIRIETSQLGTPDAPHATATGKAMLAWLPEDTIRRIVSVRGITRFTESTITKWPALIEELRLVRRNGYAMDREEFQRGVTCVGSAIRDHQGAVVGALSASAPTMRADEAHLALMRDEVVAAARTLSAELGEPGSQPLPAE